MQEKVDKMARKWTIWHKGGQNGRDGGVGTEIAIFRVKSRSARSLRQAIPLC